jgi:spore maturation protein CgeB
MTKPAKVLLVDTTQYYPSSPLFAEALDRATHSGLVVGRFVDEGPVLKRLAGSPVERVLRRVRPWPPRALGELHQTIVSETQTFGPDVVLVVKGSHLTVECLTGLKATGATLVNFATDDPFNPRTSSASWLNTLPLYDVVCSPRHANVDDLKALGVADVHFVPFGYKPEVHFPEAPRNDAERNRFQSDVCFIGGADDDRVGYFEQLVQDIPEVKLALYGGYWNRSSRLAPYSRGFAVGRDFRLAVAGAAVSINLVRRANRDDHVMRSFEVPACGGCMLTEPTSTHRALFREGREAFFFDSPAGFIQSIRSLLDDPASREQAAQAARVRITETGNRYDERLLSIVRIATEKRWGQFHPAEVHAAAV